MNREKVLQEIHVVCVHSAQEAGTPSPSEVVTELIEATLPPEGTQAGVGEHLVPSCPQEALWQESELTAKWGFDTAPQLPPSRMS